MKALKTIVATAVIVFALTTVAMAGAQRIGSRSDSATPAAGSAAAQTHQVAGVTLTDNQFARLLRSARGYAAKPHNQQADHETTRERVRDHSRQTVSESAVHVQAQHRTQTHDSGGAHDHGTQSDGTPRGGTHDGGTHHGGTHDGGDTLHDGDTHHGGTCDD